MHRNHFNWRAAFAALLVGSFMLADAPSASAYPPYLWTLQSSSGPAGRTRAAMSTDLTTGNVLLHGGDCYQMTCYTDTWSWNGTAWTNLAPSGTPPFCPSPEMVYDTANTQTVLVCGYDSSVGGTQSQIWTYDASTNAWTDRTAGVRPSGRQEYTLTYDMVAARVVLFGGRSNTGSVLNDTWEWNGTTHTWTLAVPNGAAGSPIARYGAAFAYHPPRLESVVVGGAAAGNPNLTDTWGYSALTNTWTQRATAGPTPRWTATMAYDATHGELVLHGGVSLTTNTILMDTWAWNGVWVTHPAVGGPARYVAAMAHHGPTDKTVLFGGAAPLMSGGGSPDTYVYG